ncbi:acyltransferase [Hymenobacter lapidiphilus]|uniref:acyltransferase family protein n=1 Tax=Hymenobacter sp. CCM 8763 TaxID=2303334 RepID=UPI000E357B7D|nr:acyltransferase [Hymenobacter sp. CCM 8763]RFP63341.1 acyltransferase [Hymenobacter sp. CCM 8763]
MSSSKQYFPALTGIRALAAYTVFLTHYNPFAEASWLGLLLREGNSGVTVFFVLSGFLIATRYGQRVEMRREWIVDYFRNRFARIYPVYFLVTLATFVVLYLRPDYDLIGRWAGYTTQDMVLVAGLNFTLTKAFFYPFVFTGIAQGWTLTVEECFYALAV